MLHIPPKKKSAETKITIMFLHNEAISNQYIKLDWELFTLPSHLSNDLFLLNPHWYSPIISFAYGVYLREVDKIDIYTVYIKIIFSYIIICCHKTFSKITYWNCLKSLGCEFCSNNLLLWSKYEWEVNNWKISGISTAVTERDLKSGSKYIINYIINLAASEPIEDKGQPASKLLIFLFTHQIKKWMFIERNM